MIFQCFWLATVFNDKPMKKKTLPQFKKMQNSEIQKKRSILDLILLELSTTPQKWYNNFDIKFGRGPKKKKEPTPRKKDTPAWTVPLLMIAHGPGGVRDEKPG